MFTNKCFGFYLKLHLLIRMSNWFLKDVVYSLPALGNCLHWMENVQSTQNGKRAAIVILQLQLLTCPVLQCWNTSPAVLDFPNTIPEGQVYSRCLEERFDCCLVVSNTYIPIKIIWYNSFVVSYGAIISYLYSYSYSFTLYIVQINWLLNLCIAFRFQHLCCIFYLQQYPVYYWYHVHGNWPY